MHLSGGFCYSDLHIIRSSWGGWSPQPPLDPPLGAWTLPPNDITFFLAKKYRSKSKQSTLFFFFFFLFFKEDSRNFGCH